MTTLNYRPIAAELFSALQSLSVNAIVELFTTVGFATHGQYIFSHPDAPLPNAVLVIDLNLPMIDPEKIAQDFHKLKITVNDAELEWLLVLQSAELTYFKRSKKIAEIPLTLGSSNTQARKQSHKKMGSSSLTAKRDKNQETTLDMLASVITVISPRVMHSAESLVLMYGEHSILFSYAIDRLGTLFRDQKDSTLEDVFAKWQGEFDAIYRKGDATEELFLRHAYLALLLCLVLGAAFFPQETLNEQPIAGLINLLEEQWLQPIFECNWFGWALADAELTGILRRGIIPFQSSKQGEFTQSFEAGDLFRLIYPQMVAPTARLALGEFYTPPELAQMMVGDAYTFGQVVLDPACGSGTFLSEIYRKIMDNPDQSVAAQTNACSNVIGFDVNPIAVATARVNALVQLKSLIQAEPSVRLFIDLLDSLFPENDSKGRTSELFNKCDLVIGNPPWVVLNSIHRADYKEQIKALARQWGIGLGAKQMSNLEISALFLYGAKRYLKDGGRVSFIVSNAFLSGDNHATTRQFLEFDEIHVWKFTRDVFHIHNVCLSAIFRPGFTRSTEDLSQLKVHALIFEPIVHEDSEISFNYLKEDILIPYAVVPKKATTKKNIPKSETGSGNLVKKLVSQAELTTLLPMGWNAYETLCNKGATLIPRNLVFVRIEPGGNDFCDIAVVIQNPKSPWDFDPIFRLYPESGTTTVQVEKSFVFPVLKSDSVLPFVALPPDHAFLPIDTDEGSSGYALTTRHDTRGWRISRHSTNYTLVPKRRAPRSTGSGTTSTTSGN
ncbi:MAG TPA: N-6 DNA methylase [Candidatus Lokiarchaeia archaeon]|nr:N-6 DNA methylase [Candidatus Lokiarchaeia archaeon]